MIEMKDMQEEGFEDEEAGLELSSNGPGGNGNGRASSYRPVLETDNGDEFHPDGPAEPGSWLKRRLRKQNRYMVILMGVVVIATVIFVAGKVYMSEDDVDSLVQPFERENGAVENGAENEKQQQVIDKANNNAQDQSNNPFASEVNAWHQQNNNHAHGNNHKGAAIGNFGHNGHKRPGGGKFRPHQNGDGGGGGGNQNGDSGSGAANNKSGSDTDPSTPSPSHSPVAAVDGNEKDVYCEDLTRYQKWYDTPISKEDGPQFRVINKYDHDKRAFT